METIPHVDLRSEQKRLGLPGFETLKKYSPYLRWKEEVNKR